MKAFKTLALLLLALAILGLLILNILLRYPYKDPEIEPATFAPRAAFHQGLPPLKISVIHTGHNPSPEAFVVLGGSLTKKRNMAHRAFLVEHPQATFLIEGGLGTDIDAEVAKAPWNYRVMVNNYAKGTPVVQSRDLIKLGKPLDFILLTHGHWDHLSGALDFPGIPVRILPEEIQFITQHPEPFRYGVFPHQIQKIRDRLEPLPLKEEPYENFSRSLDLFGDLSVVVVPMPGHTPGSMGIFLNQAPDRRFLITGDAIWTVDELGRPQKRSLFGEWFSDYDRWQARKTRLRLEELVDHSSEVVLVPVHDENVVP